MQRLAILEKNTKNARYYFLKNDYEHEYLAQLVFLKKLMSAFKDELHKIMKKSDENKSLLYGIKAHYTEKTEDLIAKLSVLRASKDKLVGLFKNEIKEKKEKKEKKESISVGTYSISFNLINMLVNYSKDDIIKTDDDKHKKDEQAKSEDNIKQTIKTDDDKREKDEQKTRKAANNEENVPCYLEDEEIDEIKYKIETPLPLSDEIYEKRLNNKNVTDADGFKRRLSFNIGNAMKKANKKKKKS